MRDPASAPVLSTPEPGTGSRAASVLSPKNWVQLARRFATIGRSPASPSGQWVRPGIYGEDRLPGRGSGAHDVEVALLHARFRRESVPRDGRVASAVPGWPGEWTRQRSAGRRIRVHVARRVRRVSRDSRTRTGARPHTGLGPG